MEVPGYKSKKRLNTAFKFGSKDGDIAKGAELAMKTVNRNFQMNIERYVVVNIHGLADIIEALGGVDMELTKGEAQAINYELHVKEPMDDVQRDKLEVADGVQHLDGMEAVTYGRIRQSAGPERPQPQRAPEKAPGGASQKGNGGYGYYQVPQPD